MDVTEILPNKCQQSMMYCFLLSSAELKMELLREKEMREGLEKQLSEEQKNKGRYLQHNSKQYKLLYHLG